jgi:hypothetical protein
VTRFGIQSIKTAAILGVFRLVVIGFCKVSNLSKGAIIACAFVAGSASAKYGTCSKNEKSIIKVYFVPKDKVNIV